MEMEKTIKAYAYFPVEWCFGDKHEDGRGGPPPTDPTTIYFVQRYEDGDEDGEHWAFTLTELVQYFIWGHESGEGGPIGSEHAEPMILLRDSFRQLANQLDAALARPQNEP